MNGKIIEGKKIVVKPHDYKYAFSLCVSNLPVDRSLIQKRIHNEQGEEIAEAQPQQERRLEERNPRDEHVGASHPQAQEQSSQMHVVKEDKPLQAQIFHEEEEEEEEKEREKEKDDLLTQADSEEMRQEQVKRKKRSPKKANVFQSKHKKEISSESVIADYPGDN